ncbi:MAG TPA: hypothetical protein VFL94_11130 [Actinomycetales bacterium]|nr:hypothetical protein [Actinomycetales bacterium]
MTFTTDDLRLALREAAEQPPRDASGSRLEGVRTAVRRSRRRRAGAALAITGVLAGAVGVVGLAGGPSTSDRRMPPPATSTSSPIPGGVPALWGVRDVAAKVDGRGADQPTTALTWPSDASGVVVRCTGSDRRVDVTLERADAPGTSMSFPCVSGDHEWSVHDLWPAAAALEPGGRVQLSAQLEPADPSALFGVGLLTGEDLVDGSTMTPPPGFERIASVALSHGFYYSWTGDGIDASAATAGASVDSAVLVTEGKREVRLAARCSGRSTLRLTGPEGAVTSLVCPAGERVSREVTVPLTPSSDQRFDVQLTDADPGALVQVALYGR